MEEALAKGMSWLDWVGNQEADKLCSKALAGTVPSKSVLGAKLIVLKNITSIVCAWIGEYQAFCVDNDLNTLPKPSRQSLPPQVPLTEEPLQEFDDLLEF